MRVFRAETGGGKQRTACSLQDATSSQVENESSHSEITSYLILTKTLWQSSLSSY